LSKTSIDELLRAIESVAELQATAMAQQVSISEINLRLATIEDQLIRIDEILKRRGRHGR
jgi:hypothetical protein